MKILAVSHLYPNEAEDRYGIFVSRQLRAMAQEGANVELIVPRLFAPHWLNRLLRRPNRVSHRIPLIPVKGVQLHPITYFTWPGKTFKYRAGTAIYRAIHRFAAELHRHQRFDIVYGTDWFLGCDAARRIGSELNLPSAGLGIGDDINVSAIQSNANRQKFVDIANELSITLACGDSLAQKIDEVRTGTATMSVYGVVDLERFQPCQNKAQLRRELCLPSKGKALLYAGYLEKRKGLFELIKAFETLQQETPATCLLVCGAGSTSGEESAIREFAQGTRAAKHIHFLGAISPNEIHRYMQASDVFVLPSYSEGMPNAVMEAMACGLPVVCSAVGGLPDAIGHCKAVKLVEPQDHSSLQEAIRKFITIDQDTQTLTRLAREFAEHRFGARPNARRILGRFQEALNQL